ncbi:M56 family metallopeptidase [Winogradskyella pacifica]|uniref:M56 family metallopeptidase n=1 Tax=Winogradskyella pacifica TaxID=664642 RepID=UPI0015C8EF21|nr:M56 family metallopeptidase [Winogradskyella pacifica]
METYLLKFSACLCVFWLVYVLFLERQNMHRFKRFYLLSVLILAFVIPTLTITEYVEPVSATFETAPVYFPMELALEQATIEEVPFFNLETTLWLIYGFGVLLFASRFIINLIKMQRRISKNNNIKKRSFIYVLLHENTIPHSFFRYIFFNKTRYESDNIPKEVLLHEETHARQLHSLDIIILELLQIVFWFHPLIYILKHHVKLNHEFLADQAVLEQGTDTKVYQHILLQFSSNTQNHQLSSAINYSSIKKRFTVMKTQTSKTRIWLSTVLVLPIIAILFYSFAERVEVVQEKLQNNSPLIQQNITEKQIEAYNIWAKELTLEQTLAEEKNQNHPIVKKKTLEKYVSIYRGMSENQKQNAQPFPVSDSDLSFIFPDLYSSEENTSVEVYLKKYDIYESLRTTEPHYIHKSADIQKEMDELFSDLGGLYFRMSKENKAKVKRPISRIQPYVQITLNGKTYYKKRSELTAEEIATLPPPPPPPAKQQKSKGGPNLGDTESIYNPSFLEFIIEMENEGASFYLDDEKISTEEAKAIAANNKGKRTDILTQLDANGKYVVKLSNRQNSVSPNKDVYKNAENQEKPTDEEVAEYNAWAKKINTAIEKADANPKEYTYPIVKYKDVEKHKRIYKSMTTEQKKNAEPFPKSPPPPPALASPRSTQVLNNTKSTPIEINGATYYYTQQNGKTTYYDRYGKVVDINQIPPPPPIPNDATPEQKAKMQKATDAYMKANPDKVGTAETTEGDIYEVIEIPDDLQGSVDINGETFYYTTSLGKTTYFNRYGKEVKMDNLPPPPPAPESTLDLVIRMAKTNANFFSEGKAISSDKAIDLLKKNPKLNINAQKTDTEHPLIYISKKPILIGVKGKVGVQIPKEQESILPIVNGKTITSGKLSLTRNEIKDITLSTKNGKVTEFKFKIPGKRTQQIKNNVLDIDALKHLENAKKDDHLALFAIKDGSDSEIAPIVIIITD